MILQFLKNNLKISHIIIVVLFLLFIGMIVKYENVKDEVKLESSLKSEFNNLYLKAFSDYNSLGKQFMMLNDSLVELTNLLDLKDKQLVSVKKEYSRLKSELLTESSDEDYNFLQKLYTPQDSLKWLFDSTQIKMFRLTEIEKKECNKILGVTSEKLMLTEYDLNVYKYRLSTAIPILEECSTQNIELQKENKKIKRKAKRRLFWGGGSSIGLIVLILLL